MQDKSKSVKDYEKDLERELEKTHGWNYEDHLKHWRSWGSWFSWGSPVGLGLFFISLAATLWILSQAFGWN